MARFSSGKSRALEILSPACPRIDQRHSTAFSWFALDVAYYGLSLNNAIILNVIGYSTKGATSVYQYLYNTAVGNLIIVLAGAVPGYWVSAATIDTFGRKTVQMMGFVILTILVSFNTL